jgi:hypothetical protein
VVGEVGEATRWDGRPGSHPWNIVAHVDGLSGILRLSYALDDQARRTGARITRGRGKPLSKKKLNGDIPKRHKEP